MTSDSLVQALGRVELLQGLAAERLVAIARLAERVAFKAGEVIIREGQAGDAAYLVLAGEAVATAASAEGPAREAPVPLHALVGEMAMLIETTHGTAVTCRGPVETLRITRALMHKLMAEDPALADHLVERITQRLHVMAELLRKADRAVAEAPRRFRQEPVILLPPPQGAGRGHGQEARQ